MAFELYLIPKVQTTIVPIKKKKDVPHFVSPTVNAETVDELLDKNTWKISNALDADAPTKTKTVSYRPKTFWRSNTSA